MMIRYKIRNRMMFYVFPCSYELFQPLSARSSTKTNNSELQLCTDGVCVIFLRL